MSTNSDDDDTEALRERIRALEAQVHDDPPQGGPPDATYRRGFLAALAGAAGIGAMGEVSAQAAEPGSACTWRGDQNAAGYDLLGLSALGGEVANGDTISNLAGTDLAIDADGNLNVNPESGGEAGLWTEEKDGDVTTSGGQGVDVPAVQTDDVDIGDADLVATGDFAAIGPSFGVQQDRKISTTSTSYVQSINQFQAYVKWSDWLPSGAQGAVLGTFKITTSNGDFRFRNITDSETVVELLDVGNINSVGPSNYTPTTTASPVEVQAQFRTKDGGSSTDLLAPSLHTGVQV